MLQLVVVGSWAWQALLRPRREFEVQEVLAAASSMLVASGLILQRPQLGSLC